MVSKRLPLLGKHFNFRLKFDLFFLNSECLQAMGPTDGDQVGFLGIDADSIRFIGNFGLSDDFHSVEINKKHVIFIGESNKVSVIG